MNKKSVYRQIEFTEKDTNIAVNLAAPGQGDQNKGDNVGKILAEKIVSQNLNDNIGEI